MRVPVPKWLFNLVNFFWLTIIFLFVLLVAIKGVGVAQIIAIIIVLLVLFAIYKGISGKIKKRKEKEQAQKVFENLKAYLLIENMNDSELFIESHPELASRKVLDILTQFRDQEIIKGNINVALFFSVKRDLLEKHIDPNENL